MKKPRTLMARIALVLVSLALSSAALADATQKEWTFLLFLNGNNNLDSFGTMNINQMEEVGSNENLNLVVQWGSYSRKKVQRLYIQKDNDKNKVTSPVVQDMGRTDMGDYRNVVEFVKWAKVNYPAKHYFLAIWDHGSGWHTRKLKNSRDAVFSPMDISWDDFTDNHITTAQMGLIAQESAAVLGQKLDIYGSDACLMAMVEIASEMAPNVEMFVGSQELEPGEGWPYSTFLKRWVAAPTASAKEVSGFLVNEYLTAYSGGIYGRKDVTLSAFDMNLLPAFESAVAQLGTHIKLLSLADRKTLVNAVTKSQNFYMDDYVDFADFLINLESVRILGIPGEVLANAKALAQKVVSSNGANGTYYKAKGLSMWIPSSSYTYSQYSSQYSSLVFHKNTGWGDALAKMHATTR